MSFLLAFVSKLGDWLTKLAPLFFAYKAGSSAKQHEFDEAVKKVLEEDNEELRANSVLPDTAIADKLRERGAKKLKDNNKR
jgi:hypothetical protein